MLQARREKIAESLANAEKIKTDVAKTEAERQKILADAGDKANKLIDEARQAAARVRETETQKAIAAAEQIVARRAKPPPRNARRCSRRSNEKSAAWWSRPPLRSPERFSRPTTSAASRKKPKNNCRHKGFRPELMFQPRRAAASYK